jgi:hypothetical protein
MPTNIKNFPSWEAGLFVQPLYVLPSLEVYLNNIKRLIIENQATVANILQQVYGNPSITYPVIPDNLIFLGTDEITANTIGAYIRGTIITRIDETAQARRDLEFEIIVVSGTTDSYELAYRDATRFISLLESLFMTVPKNWLSEEMLFGWPTNKGVPKRQVQLVFDGLEAQPQISDLNYQLGSVPRLILRYKESAAQIKQTIILAP